MKASISEFRLARTGELVADGNDGLRLAINLGDAEMIIQSGREVVLGAGEATLMSCTDPFSPRGGQSAAKSMFR